MADSSTQERKQASFSGTVSVGRPFGIPIRLHFTFVLLLAFLVVAGVSDRQSSAIHVLYILALFVSVLLHEMGHALVSKRFGIKTIEIVMFPIGGVARLEKTPPPRQELWIALAGPAVNVFISVIISGFLFQRGVISRAAEIWQPTDDNLWERILFGNLVLAIFNLLPAFPMDGGRVLRSILALSRPEEEATRIAAATGRTMAICIGLYGLVTQQYMLIFIAFFVYLGASQEGAVAVGKQLMQGAVVRAAMVTDFQTLSHGDTIRDAANLLLATSQQDFPVVLGQQVVGLLGRNALLRAMAVDGPESYVAGAMQRDFVRVEPDVDLSEAIPLLSAAGNCALVMEGETLIGLLTSENLSEFLLLRRFGMPVEETKRQHAARAE